jgi:hypothetical protein
LKKVKRMCQAQMMQSMLKDVKVQNENLAVIDLLDKVVITKLFEVSTLLCHPKVTS